MTIFANFLWNLKSAQMTQERFRNVYLMFLMCFTFLFVDSFFFTYQPAYPVNTLHHARISDWFLDTGNSYSVMGEQTEYCTIKPLYMYLFDGLIKIVYQIWSIKQAFDYFIWFFFGGGGIFSVKLKNCLNCKQGILEFKCWSQLLHHIFIIKVVPKGV